MHDCNEALVSSDFRDNSASLDRECPVYRAKVSETAKVLS